jgi:hypothetical protein
MTAAMREMSTHHTSLVIEIGIAVSFKPFFIHSCQTVVFSSLKIQISIVKSIKLYLSNNEIYYVVLVNNKYNYIYIVIVS